MDPDPDPDLPGGPGDPAAAPAADAALLERARTLLPALERDAARLAAEAAAHAADGRFQQAQEAGLAWRRVDGEAQQLRAERARWIGAEETAWRQRHRAGVERLREELGGG